VLSVDDFLNKIVQAGGKALTKKTAIPGVGYSAYCEDMRETCSDSFKEMRQPNSLMKAISCSFKVPKIKIGVDSFSGIKKQRNRGS